ncbi:MAG: hypothetical protein ACUVV0_03850 [Anaerolineae bacterium]
MTRLKLYLPEICIFLILLSCYAYFFPRWASWNQNSRLDLVMAIVDKDTVSIDEYYQNTGDYAIYEGHHYSTKAPGSAFLGVPVYWVFRQAVNNPIVTSALSLLESNQAVAETLRDEGTGLLPEKLYFALALYVVTFFTVSVPSALLGVVLYRFTGYYSSSQAHRIWVTLTYGLATSAFPYSGSYMGHQIVAAFLFISFYLIFLVSRGSVRPAILPFIGFLIGFAVITEYPTVLIAVALFVYAFFRPAASRTNRLPKKAWIILLASGSVLPCAIWIIYNYQIYHNPIGFGYLYAPLYTDKNNVGFFSLTHPNFEALWGIMFGSYRGLFFLSPVMLFAIPGFYYFGRARSRWPEFCLCLWSAVSFFLFNGSSVMWDGGFAVGPRYILPMLPFMALALIFFAEKAWKYIWARAAIGFLTLWSILFVWAETIGGQSFPDWTLNPLFNYSLPRLVQGDIARNWGTILGFSGWNSLIPLILVELFLLWILFRQLEFIPKPARHTGFVEGKAHEI